MLLIHGAFAPTFMCGDHMYRKSLAVAFCFILSGGAAWLSSGEIRQNFLKVKEQIANSEAESRYSDQTLLNNVERALKMSLLRHYSLCSYEKIEVSASNIEASAENPNMYYFQYEKFAGYFIFSRNPRQYLQSPIDEKILLEPGAQIVRLKSPECKDTKNNKKESTSQE